MAATHLYTVNDDGLRAVCRVQRHEACFAGKAVTSTIAARHPHLGCAEGFAG